MNTYCDHGPVWSRAYAAGRVAPAAEKRAPPSTPSGGTSAASRVYTYILHG